MSPQVYRAIALLFADRAEKGRETSAFPSKLSIANPVQWEEFIWLLALKEGKFGGARESYEMAASATPRLDMTQTLHQTAEVNGSPYSGESC